MINSDFVPLGNNETVAYYSGDISAIYDMKTGNVLHINNLDDSITFHTLRHSYATEFIKNGGDIWELKNILGHSSINTTSIYLHMAENFKNVYSPINEVSKNV